MRRFTSTLVAIVYTDTLLRLLMRRFCFFLLAVLFPLQLFAGVLEPVSNAWMQVTASSESRTSQVVSGSIQLAMAVADSVENGAAEPDLQSADLPSDLQPDFSKVQADLEDQTLPTPLATVALDWQSFPHLYPHVSGGSSAVLDLLRPPPLAAV